jgi:hypothetical protein
MEDFWFKEKHRGRIYVYNGGAGGCPNWKHGIPTWSLIKTPTTIDILFRTMLGSNALDSMGTHSFTRSWSKKFWILPISEVFLPIECALSYTVSLSNECVYCCPTRCVRMQKWLVMPLGINFLVGDVLFRKPCIVVQTRCGWSYRFSSRPW